MKTALFEPKHFYPVELRKKVGATKFGKREKYLPGTYKGVNQFPLDPVTFGTRRANAKMHKRTNKR